MPNSEDIPKDRTTHQKNPINIAGDEKFGIKSVLKKTGREGKSKLGPSENEIKRILDHFRNGTLRPAEELATLLTKRFPMDPFGWAALGLALRQTGRLRESIAPLQRSVALSTEDAEAHNNLGVALQELGRFEEAEASLKEAVMLKPGFSLAHSNLGNTQQRLGKKKEAEVSHKNAIALQPDRADAHTNLGFMLLEAGRLDEAEAAYRQAIALRPDNPEAFNGLGITLTSLGRLGEARASHDQGLSLRPSDKDALLNRSILLFDTNEFELALSDADASNTERSKCIGLEALYALGRIDEILVRIEREYQLNPHSLPLAAFAAFISQTIAQDVANRFCPNPMAFLHFSSIHHHLEGASEFISALTNELENIPTVWEPPTQSTKGGYRTRVHMNLFEHRCSTIARLESIILD
jgi:Flp pilus assembly protein TadD